MRKWLYFLVVTSIICTRCGDTTIVGSELFEGEGLNLTNVDSLDIQARTNLVDSIRLFTFEASSASGFLMGILDDPLFGSMKSSFVTEVHFAVDPRNLQELTPDYQDGDVLDSMILVLELDPAGFYGVQNDRFDFEIFLVEESINDRSIIFSNDEIAFGSTPVTTVDDVGIPTDSTVVFFPSLGTSVREFPQLRLPLETGISDILFNDLRTIQNDTSFVNEFFGIRIEATPTSENSMIGVDVSSLEINSRIQTFYSRQDSALLYEYALNDLAIPGVPLGRKYSDFDRDLSGATINTFLDSKELGDSLLFIQSMLGTNIELDLSSVLELGDVLINQATLELTIAELPGDDLSIKPPIENLILSFMDETGNLQLISEVNEALLFEEIDLRFGGTVQEVVDDNVMVQRYSMNVTRTVIDMFNGILPTTLFITPLSVTGQPRRTILYGPDNAQFPIKLNLSLTSL